MFECFISKHMKTMNKQIVNCLTKCFVNYLNQNTINWRHLRQLNTINVNIFRHLADSSNQRIITVNNNKTISEQNDNKIVDKTKANIRVTFIRSNGKQLEALAKDGDSLLDVVINNDIDLDGFGACEGTLACSTCHLIFTKEDYEKIPNKPTDEELDMLDLAYDLTDTSRLGCQVILNKGFDGLVVKVPESVNDVRSS